MIGRRIAIDFGDKWAGIAISDDSGLLASPYKSVRAEEVLNEINQIAQDGEVAVIYIGLPLHLSGQEGASVKKVRNFAVQVASLKIAPIRLVDERLSTKSASSDKGLISKFGIDALAAAEILKFALEGERLQGTLFGRSLDD
ncbi:MAG: hypothetical protein RLZZ12_8 [Actinomycetota bacterium]|jgi:putative Holliday junction resolvase